RLNAPYLYCFVQRICMGPGTSGTAVLNPVAPGLPKASARRPGRSSTSSSSTTARAWYPPVVSARYRIEGWAPFSRASGPTLGAALVPAGVILMLTGLAGDLISIVLGGSGHAGEPFVSFAHPDPWRLVMFAGVILAAVGAIRWAIGQRTEWGGLAGAMISLLL